MPKFGERRGLEDILAATAVNANALTQNYLAVFRRIQGRVSSPVRPERVGRAGVEGRGGEGVARSQSRECLIPPWGVWT